MISLKKIILIDKKGNQKTDPKEPEIILKLSPEQISIFRHQTRNKFQSKCRSFLNQNFPDFVKNHNDDSLDSFISKIISFGSKYNIKKEINIQKLLVIQIKYDFLKETKLPDELEKILNYPDREEDKKVNYFHKQLIYRNG